MGEKISYVVIAHKINIFYVFQLIKALTWETFQKLRRRKKQKIGNEWEKLETLHEVAKTT